MGCRVGPAHHRLCRENVVPRPTVRCVGPSPHPIPRSKKIQKPFQIISKTIPNTFKHRSKTTQQAVRGPSQSVRGLCEVCARLVWASPPSMSGAQHTANNSFRRQTEFTPQSRSSRLRANEVSVRGFRKHGTVGSARTKRFENTVLSALCLQSASKTSYHRLQNASKTLYCRLCDYKTLGLHVRNHLSQSLFSSTELCSSSLCSIKAP